MGSVITIRYGTDLDAATVAAKLARAGTNWTNVRRDLSDYIDPVAGVRGGGIAYTIDDVSSGTPLVDSTVNVEITFANITAGETLVIGTVTLTWAVAAVWSSGGSVCRIKSASVICRQ